MAGKRRKRKTQYPDEFLKAKDLLTAARQLLVVGTPQQVSSMTREQLQAFKQEVARAKFRRKWAWLHEEAALLRTTSFSEGVPPEVSGHSTRSSPRYGARAVGAPPASGVRVPSAATATGRMPARQSFLLHRKLSSTGSVSYSHHVVVTALFR